MKETFLSVSQNFVEDYSKINYGQNLNYVRIVSVARA
jgi:hypothetical protein